MEIQFAGQICYGLLHERCTGIRLYSVNCREFRSHLGYYFFEARPHNTATGKFIVFASQNLQQVDWPLPNRKFFEPRYLAVRVRHIGNIPAYFLIGHGSSHDRLEHDRVDVAVWVTITAIFRWVLNPSQPLPKNFQPYTTCAAG